MKNKKLLAILLAVFSSFAVATTTLTACGGGDDSDPDTEQSSTGGDTSGGSTDGSSSGSETAHTHTYGDWVVTKIPTDTETGTATRTCTANDDTQTVTLPALSDTSYTVSDITATETEDGTAKYTITINGVDYSFTVNVSATGTGGSGDQGGSGDEGDDDDDDTKTVAATGITLSRSTHYATIGYTCTLTATVTPSTATNKNVTWTSSDTSIATVSGGVVTGVAAGTATITATSEDGSYTASCTVTVREVSTTEIATPQDLNAFRALGELTEATNFKLINDIDMSGYTLDDTTVILNEGSTFDGQGYTISNVSYTAGTTKVGILFKTITGGTVTNVKFLNCSISSENNESAAILAGECNGSATISKIEFNACTATVTGKDYAGLIFARREGSTDITINISEITAKNGCKVTCTTYGGFLVGDITSATNLVFKDLDVAGELESSGNFSFIAGRTRGGTVSVENAVISAAITTSSTSVNYGLFSGNNSLTTLTIKNVLIVESNISNLYQASKAPTSITVENLVTVSGVTVDQSTGTGTATATYLKDTLGFDFTDVWTTEGDDGYRLAAASTNVKSDDATITSLSLSTGNAETRIKKGGEFSTDGLSVTGVYSDGVQLLLSENDDYTVDHTAVDVDAAGTYTVTVTSKEDGSVVATYTVTVVEETGFVVYDEFVTTVYVASSTTAFDTANLVVKSVWSDGEEEALSNGTGGYTVDSTSYSMATAGTYSVKITYGTYDYKTIAITVTSAAATVSENQVDIYVKADQTDTVTESEGVYTFNTVKDAIDYLEACNYDSTVVKVVHIGAGKYEAKITTDLCNLTLIGENTDTEDDISVLTYSAVESTEDIVNGGTYGLDCATLQVNGTNLTIKNLTIRNDFDYINDSAKESSPQGLALTIAGDKAIVENCHLYGNQDTLYLKSGRAYFTNTLIEGNVDFIFGNATGIAYFYKCEIRAISRFAEGSEGSNNGYVTAMKATSSDKPDYGYIFDTCAFTDDGKVLDGSMSLGRPWGASATVAMINCSFTKAYSTLAYDGSAKSRWYEMSGNSPVNADFCEYGSTGDGAITEAVNGGKVLTETEAANYTIANIFAATNGNCTWSDSWDPTNTVTYLVTVTDGVSTTYATLSVSGGATLTADEVKAAVNEKLDSPYEVIGVYSDTYFESPYTSSEITAATTLYVQISVGDLTITESVTYSVSDFSAVSSGTSYIGKLKIVCGESGSFVEHNSSYYKILGDASITLTLNAGSSVTVSMYDQTLAVNGTAVATDDYVDLGSGNYSYTYTATQDGEQVVLSMISSGSQLYISSIAVNVPVVYTETTTINLVDTSFTTIQNGGTATYKGIYIDTGTSGKYGLNSSQDWMQVNAGTTLTLNVAEGSTVTVDSFYANSETTTYYTVSVEGTVATITVTTNTYFRTITVTVPDGGSTGGDTNPEDDEKTVESIEISGSTSVAVGSSINLSAEVKMSDGTTSTSETVTWSSEDTSVATVDENGVVTGVAAGTAKITATSSSNSEVTATYEITVTTSAGATVKEVTITEADGATEVTVGGTLTLSAEATMTDDNYSYGGSIAWSSSDESIATVTKNEDGTCTVTAVAAGDVTITATADGEVTGKYEITVTAASTITYSNAEVNISSLVTAGTLSADSYTEETTLYSDTNTTISVTAESGSAVSIDTSSKSIEYLGTTYSFGYRLKLGGEGSSSKRSIKVELAAGATITVFAMSSSGNTTRTLALYDSTYAALNKNQTSDGNSLVAFVYTVTESGTYYIASTSGGINVYGIIVDYSTVVTSVSIADGESGTSTELVVGSDTNTVTLTATPVYSKGSNVYVAWVSSDTSVATVSDSGVVTAVGEGTATITAYANGVASSNTYSVTVTVTVTGAEITGSTQVEIDDSITLTAAVTMSDGTTVDADSVTWSCDNTDVATVDENGNVTGVAEGEVLITASVTYEGKTYEAKYAVKVVTEIVEATSVTYSYSIADYYTSLSSATLTSGTVYFNSDNTVSTSSGTTSTILSFVGGSSVAVASDTLSDGTNSYQYEIKTGGKTSESNGRYFVIDLSKYSGYTISIKVICSPNGSSRNLMITDTITSSTDSTLGIVTAGSSDGTSTYCELKYEGTVEDSALYICGDNAWRIFAIEITLTENTTSSDNT